MTKELQEIEVKGERFPFTKEMFESVEEAKEKLGEKDTLFFINRSHNFFRQCRLREKIKEQSQ